MFTCNSLLAAEHLSLFSSATAFENHWARATWMQSRLVQSKAQKHTCPLQTCDLRLGAAESYISQSLGSGAHGGVGEGGKGLCRRPQEPPDSQVGYLCYVQVCSEGESITLVLRQGKFILWEDMGQPLERHLWLS